MTEYMQNKEMIKAEAAQWFARMQSDDISAKEKHDFEYWCTRDARHMLAYEQCCTLWLMSEKLKQDPSFISALEKQNESPESANTKSRFTTRFAAQLALAAMTIFGFFFLMTFDTSREQYFASAVGEQRRIHLSDNSTIILNTNSQISVDYTRNKRMIHLQQGEAYFDVAKDTARVFEVRIGESVVRAVGTAFNIAKYNNAVDVDVTEGIVELKLKDLASSQPAKLLARLEVGQSARHYAGETKALIGTSNFDHIKAWKEKKIYFKDTSLKDAVGEFNRYIDTRIVILDKELQSQKISGLFQQGDVDAFLFSLERAFDARIEKRDKHIFLMQQQL